jgi:hypothetical protein
MPEEEEEEGCLLLLLLFQKHAAGSERVEIRFSKSLRGIFFHCPKSYIFLPKKWRPNPSWNVLHALAALAFSDYVDLQILFLASLKHILQNSP